LIKPVSFSAWLGTEEAKPLIAEYAKECSIPAIGEVDPQPETYAAMERAGLMQSFAAYHGGLVGFANVLTPVLPHYGKRVATVETLYVTPVARRLGIGRELMLAIERYAASLDCAGVLYSSPAGGQLERVLEAKKYLRTNAVFFKKL